MLDQFASLSQMTQGRLDSLQVILTPHQQHFARQQILAQVTAAVWFRGSATMSDKEAGMNRKMFQHIMVALDGSVRSERVLPYVVELAEKFDSHIILVRVTTVATTFLTSTGAIDGVVSSGQIADMWHSIDLDREQAVSYLQSVASRLREQGLEVDYVQEDGEAATTIVKTAQRLDVDLIALASRGNGGLKRMIFGSVADEVERNASCPVFVLRCEDSPVRIVTEARVERAASA
jgi:nucleotide-binding universal stress UspA family protein